MDWDWAALGAALRARRDVLRLTRPELAELAGVHPGTIKNYETGEHSYDKIPKSVLQIEAAIGWAPGSAKAVLSGGAPTLLETPSTPLDSPALPPLRERLPKLVMHELENGEIYATETYDLTVGGGMRMIVVVVRNPNDPPVDPEQLRRDNRIWLRAQHKLRGMKPVAWEPGDPWDPDEDETPPQPDVQ